MSSLHSYEYGSDNTAQWAVGIISVLALILGAGLIASNDPQQPCSLQTNHTQNG